MAALTSFSRATYRLFSSKTLHKLSVPAYNRCIHINIILYTDQHIDVKAIKSTLQSKELYLGRDVLKKVHSVSSQQSVDVALQTVFERLDYFQSLDIPPRVVTKVFNAWPLILTTEMSKIMERADFWGHELMDMNWFRATTAKFPRFLAYDISTNIRPKINYLQEYFNDEVAISHIIRKYPYFLISRMSTIEERLQRIADIANDRSDALTLIKRQPRLLYATSSAFILKVIWLEKLGFKRHEIVNLLLRYPSIFVTNTIKLEEKLDWLVQAGYGDGDPRRIIWINPPCLGYTVESMKTKFYLLRDHLKIDLEQIHNCPSALGYSTKRLYHRITYLKHLNIWHGPAQPSLGSFITKSDRDFCSLIVKRPYEEYMDFIQDLPPYTMAGWKSTINTQHDTASVS